MRAAMAIAAGAACLLTVFAAGGCRSGAEQGQSRGSVVTPTAGQPAPAQTSAPGRSGAVDTNEVGADLESVDNLLNEADSALTSADQSPDDAD